MAAHTRDNATNWIKWKRATRVALIHNIPLRGTKKVLLRAICDCLGEKEAATLSKTHKDAWAWPSVGWLASACGCSERWIQKAKAELIQAGLLEEDQRFERGSGRQESNRIRIVWQEVARLTISVPMCVWKQPQKLSQRPPVRRAQSSPSPRTQFTPPVNSPRTEFTPPVKSTSPLECHLTKEPNLPSSNEAAQPQKPDGEGKNRFWQKAVREPQQLRQAVKNRDATWMQQAWSEAIAAGWQPDTRDGFQRFLAAAFYVINPPKGMLAIHSPTRVLRDKLITNDWRTGRMDGLDDDWAKAMLRAIEQPEPITRSSDLTETVAAAASTSVATQLSKLQALKKGTT